MKGVSVSEALFAYLGEIMTTHGVVPDRTLPEHLQDDCPYCGARRTEHQGNNDRPCCPRQGCPGQH